MDKRHSHKKTDAELAAREAVNVSVKGPALVALRSVRDEISKELGFEISLSDALLTLVKRYQSK